jgi:hypothetical protein
MEGHHGVLKLLGTTPRKFAKAPVAGYIRGVVVVEVVSAGVAAAVSFSASFFP